MARRFYTHAACVMCWDIYKPPRRVLVPAILLAPVEIWCCYCRDLIAPEDEDGVMFVALPMSQTEMRCTDLHESWQP